MNRSRSGCVGLTLAAAVVLVACDPASVAAQAPGDGGYTPAQAESGRAIYERECAVCHQSNLQGTFEAPQLAGESFLLFWADLSPGDLFVRISGSMPPGQAGSLTDEAYLDVVAYLLQANGAPAGGMALTEATTVPIGTLAGGATQAVAAAGGPPAGAPAAAPPPPAPSAASDPGGVTVAGTVEDYRPVTDAMLRNPDDGDWLMIRRNYQAWNYSPLGDIDRSSVGDLELAWVWAMNEGGWNAPSPIVHDGVMYLASIGPVVQALDAATGDLIWEHEVEVATTGYSGMSRNLAIYEDKLFMATPDARLIALDARTGERVWDTVIADHAEGLPQHERAGRGRRDPGAGPQRVRPVHAGELLHQRLRRGHGRAALALQHRRPLRRAGRQHLGQRAGLPARGRRHLDHRQLRPRPRPGLLRGGAGQAVGGAQPRHDGGRPRALHQLDRRPPAGRRRARVALPARAGRDPGPGRGVRSGCWSTSAAARRSSAPASTASSGSWTARPASSSATRRPSTRTCSTISIPRPVPSPTGRTSPTRGSSSSCPRVRAPPAGRTGTRWVITRTRGCWSCRSRSRAWSWRPARSPSSSARAASG